MEIVKTVDMGRYYSNFVCPHCGKTFNIKEAVVSDEITDSKSASSTIQGRKVIHKFIDTHHKVRFCKKYAKRRQNVRTWARRFFWIIAPILLTIFFVISGWKDRDSFFLDILTSLLMSYLTIVFFIAIPFSWILKLFYFDFNLEKARKGNALLSIWN